MGIGLGQAGQKKRRKNNKKTGIINELTGGQRTAAKRDLDARMEVEEEAEVEENQEQKEEEEVEKERDEERFCRDEE